MIKYHLYLFDSEGDRDCVLASIERNPGYFNLAEESLGYGNQFSIDDAKFPIDEEVGPMVVYFYERLDLKPKEFYTNIENSAIIDTISNGLPSKFYIFVRSNTIGMLRPIYDPIDNTIPVEVDSSRLFDDTFDDTFN